MIKNKIQVVTLLLVLWITQSSVNATPWVDPNNIYLRVDIQQLADNNIIKSPINHWPLAWQDIGKDITSVDTNTLSTELKQSYYRVMFHYRQAKQAVSATDLKLTLATDTPKFQRFSSSNKEKGEMSVTKSFMSDSFAGQLSVTRTLDPQDGKSFRLDNSFLAYRIANWNITLGAVPMWWGPGWDTALLMSNNARPIPGISINRQQALAFETPWLSWIGPWSFNSFMGQLEDNGRAVPNALLWSNRLSVRPLPSLELGFSRSTMWAGDGRDSGFSAFWDIIKPSESDNKVRGVGDVNDLGSIDFRWTSSLFNQPFGLYYEMGFEDYGISTIAPSKRSHLLGVDTDLYIFETLVSLYVEASDTYHATCQCIYEHSQYRSGYRYRDRIIGSTYGNNATSLTFGVTMQTEKHSSINASLHFIEQNKQNEQSSQNTTTPYEEILELNVEYVFIFADSRWTLATTARNSKINAETDNDMEFSLGWEYKL